MLKIPTNYIKYILNLPSISSIGINSKNYRFVSYVQGQEPEKRIREYFYFIDHQGMLFLDDARMKNFTSCFKDKKFLEFFFKRIKLNDTNRYKNDFPFLSLCGRERNYIRCDDVPIVYTHLIKSQLNKENNENNNKINIEKLSYNYGSETMIIDFQPSKIYMSIKSGRVYHPAWYKVGNIGLIRSKLAIELSKYFIFENGENESPTHFKWNDIQYELDKEWIKDTILHDKL